MSFQAYKVVAFLAMFCVAAVSGAQQLTPPSKHGAAVKRRAGTLLSGTVVSVFLVDGTEKDGSFLSARPTTLTLLDEATKSEVEVGYDSVRSIKQGTHTSRRGHVILVVVLSAIAAAAIGGYIAGK